MGWLLSRVTNNPMLLLWIAGIAFVAGGSTAWTIQGWRLDAAKAETKVVQTNFDSFTKETKRLGEQAEKDRQKDIEDRQVITDRREKELEDRYATLDSKYRAAVARVRESTGTDPGGSGAKPLSSAASLFAGANRPADLAGRLERLEIGVLGLANRGNQAIERTIACKLWVEEQLKH